MTRRTAFLIGLIFELVAVFGLFVPSAILRTTGTPVSLQTISVDPTSVFRGQYVMLNYEVGQGLPQAMDYSKPVYVTLEKKGDLYQRVAFGSSKPVLQPGQVCLKGSLQYRQAFFPDIGQYFVEEGKGRELEQARNSHKLIVDARVGPNCNAIIEGVRLGPEAPLVPDPSTPDQKPMPPAAVSAANG